MTNYDSSNIDYNLDAYKPSSDPKIDIKYPLERVISHLYDLGGRFTLKQIRALFDIY